ncbi:MAG: diaminopimelate dehydrogenase [Propionibacteriaceae bacterium]|jgi:diaminopimelate dehydrogenase|nr:diaminopimelate dehydrogenase [Propionibacteriaceae bacterium]
MGSIKVAVVGYGHVGQFAVEAVNAAPDMELLGVVRRQIDPELAVRQVSDIKELGEVDVALLCLPTRSVQDAAEKYLAMGINTVDSFDIHGSIVDLRRQLNQAATASGRVAVLAAGWDPGSDSMVRALMEAIVPRGLTYTNFGPGMSMGHSVAVKAIDGVKDALSVTIPLGTGVHRRMVYVELAEGADLAKVTAAIKADPYFASDETHVQAIDDLAQVIDVGHGVEMTRKGVSGQTHNQLLEFSMRINNPALTSQVMVAAARASLKQIPGAYTMIELPIIDLIAGDRESAIGRLV